MPETNSSVPIEIQEQISKSIEGQKQSWKNRLSRLVIKHLTPETNSHAVTPDSSELSDSKEIDWSKEIGDDTFLEYGYVIPNEPAEILKEVQSAVVKLLTGYDYDEYLELEMTVEDVSEKQEMQQIFQEAQAQGWAASQASHQGSWGVYYDYWQDRTLIKSGISLQRMAEDPTHVLIKTKSDHIGDQKGLPTQLVEKNWRSRRQTQEQEVEQSRDNYVFAKAKLDQLGLNMEGIDQRVSNDGLSELLFRTLRLDRAKEVYAAQGADFLSLDQKGAIAMFKPVYESLTSEEKKLLQAGAEVSIVSHLGREFTSGQQKADLDARLSISKVHLMYDEVSEQLVADLDNAKDISLGVTVVPVLSGSVSEEGLLKIHRETSKLIKDAGITSRL